MLEVQVWSFTARFGNQVERTGCGGRPVMPQEAIEAALGRDQIAYPSHFPSHIRTSAET